MEQLFSKLEEFTGHVKDYVETRIAAVKLETAARASKIVSNLAAVFIILGILFLFFVFASVAAALALSAWIGKAYAGFLIIAAFYLLLVMIIWTGRERILRIPIMNSMIKQLFKKDEFDEKD
jgi:hypothetical protein